MRVLPQSYALTSVLKTFHLPPVWFTLSTREQLILVIGLHLSSASILVE